MAGSMYGQKERLLDIWPTLSESPILRLFGYSPLIHAAYHANLDLFTTLSVREPYFPCTPTPGEPTNALQTVGSLILLVCIGIAASRALRSLVGVIGWSFAWLLHDEESVTISV